MDLIQEHHFLIPKLLNNSIACCSLINLDFLLPQTKIVWWKHYSSDVWLLKELWNCNLILNCFFSKENYTLAHKTKSTYGKLNFPPISSIYLIFSYLEIQKRLIQTKAYYKLSYSFWKETSHKPLTVAAAETSFPSVCTIDTTCFDECFSFHVKIGRHYFL